MNEEKFYNIQEFSNLIRVHPNTLRKAIKDGRIQAFRVGIGKRGDYRIPQSEINRICEFDMIKVIEGIVDRRLEERKV